MAFTPKIDRKVWKRLEAEYRAGNTIKELSERYGIDRARIDNRAYEEKWVRDAVGEVRARSVLDLNPEVVQDPAMVEEQIMEMAIAQESKKRAAVLARHRQELHEMRPLFDDVKKAYDEQDMDKAHKVAGLVKKVVEARAAHQAAERKAWDLDRDYEKDKEGLEDRDGKMKIINDILDMVEYREIKTPS